MLSASVEFAGAVDAPVNTPIARVMVDLGDGTGIQDVTDRVTKVTVDRAVTTDLPEAATQVVGYPAAEATITLGAGSGIDPASWTYSPYRVAYTFGGPVTVEFGYETSAGPEYLTKFTGYLQSVQAASGDVVTLKALDGRAATADLVTLPPASRYMVQPLVFSWPGLDGQWVIDHLLRSSGYYSSPPSRADVRLSVTMHGSAFPDYLWWYWDVGTAIPGPTVVSGVFGEALRASHNYRWFSWYTPRVVTLDYPYSVDMEGWFNTGGHSSGVFFLVVGGGSSEDKIVLSVYKGVLYTDVRRYRSSDGAFVRNFHTANLAVGPGWHYIASRVVFHADGTFTVWQRVDGTTGGPLAGNNPPLTSGSQAVRYITACQPEGSADTAAAAEAILVHNPQNTGTAEPTWWNDAFVPDVALSPSLASLTAVPEAGQVEPWRICQDVAAAEFGTFGFAEDGQPYFHTRDWLESNPDSTTVVRTLTATRDITVLAAKLDTTGVYGTVTAKVTSKVPRSGDEHEWKAEEKYRLDGTLRVEADAGTPLIVPDYSFDRMTSNEAPTNASGPISGYRANTASDGSGTDMAASFTSTITPTGIIVTSTTTGGWLVDTAGDPALYYDAIPIVDGEPVTVSAGSGDPELALSDSPWRQRALGLDAVLQDLSDTLSEKRPILTDIEVMPDPRLQLTDRVRVTDTDGLALDAEFHIQGSTLDYVPGEFTQKLTLRGAASLFDPRDVPNMQMWFDARWPSGDEGIASPSDGSAISSWTDIVGGYSVTQGTASAQPTYNASATATGAPALRFDGVDDYLRGSIPSQGGGPMTFFIVAEWYGSYDGVSSVPVEVVNNVFLVYEHSNGNRLTVWANGAQDLVDYLPRGAGTLLVSVTWQPGGKVDAWANGVKVTSLTGAGTTTSTDLLVGNSAGSTSLESNWFEGDLSTLLFYDRVLTDAERQKIERYLARIFGITIWKPRYGQ
jgi:hypothetical protein